MSKLTILITGATYGIGEHTARKLATPNNRLILTARTTERLLDIKQSLIDSGAEIEIFTADLYDPSQTESLIDFLKSFEVDVFISNAGKSICRSVADSASRPQDVERTIRLNYTSPARIISSLTATHRPLHIVNISSMNAILPAIPLWSAYGASKIAMKYWIESAAAEPDNNLTVSNIYFPLVRTRMITPTKAYSNVKVMSPERAATIVANIVNRGRGRWKPWWACIALVIIAVMGNLYKKLSLWIIKR